MTRPRGRRLGPVRTDAVFAAWSASRVAVVRGGFHRSAPDQPARCRGPAVEVRAGRALGASRRPDPVEAERAEVAEHHRRHAGEAEQERPGHAEQVRHQDELLGLADPAGVGPGDPQRSASGASRGCCIRRPAGSESRSASPTSEMATWASAAASGMVPAIADEGGLQPPVPAGRRGTRRCPRPRSRPEHLHAERLRQRRRPRPPPGRDQGERDVRDPADPLDRRGRLEPGRRAELDQADDRPVDLDGQRAGSARRPGRPRRRGSGACRGRRSRPGRTRPARG